MVPNIRCIRSGLGETRWRGVEDDFKRISDPTTGEEIVSVVPTAPLSSVEVLIVSPFVTAWIGEHLGQQIDVTALPPGYAPLPADTFPGTLQAPVVAGVTRDGVACLLGALAWDRTVRVAVSGSVISLAFSGPFQPGAPETLSYFYAEDNGPGTARQKIGRLVRRYRALVAPQGFTRVENLRHGIHGFQAQNTATPRIDFLKFWATHGHRFGGAGVWGVGKDGECCEPTTAIRPAMEWIRRVIELLVDAGYPVWLYTRPDKGGGVVDRGFFQFWCSETRDRSARCYVDTAGFRDCRELNIPKDSVIEGASLAINAPALVSNAYTGGGFAVASGGVLPRTMPDGRPHPANPQPWMTAAPWFGTLLNCGGPNPRQLLWGPHNTDGYFDAEYWIPPHDEATTWVEPGLRRAFLLGHLLCPREIRPLHTVVMDIRDAAGWSDAWEYRDVEGLSGVPADVGVTRFVTPEGKNYLAVDQGVNTRAVSITVDGRAVMLPARPLALVEVAA